NILAVGRQAVTPMKRTSPLISLVRTVVQFINIFFFFALKTSIFLLSASRHSRCFIQLIQFQTLLIEVQHIESRQHD
ncbi:MAG: hypothetical protein AB2705_19005, partial [Candidatus Thiodiazotropha sp.]